MSGNDLGAHAAFNEAKYPIRDHGVRLGACVFLFAVLPLSYLALRDFGLGLDPVWKVVAAVLVSVGLGVIVGRWATKLTKARTARRDAEVRVARSKERDRQLQLARQSGDLDKWAKRK